jgi:hypothetical protein
MDLSEIYQTNGKINNCSELKVFGRMKTLA